jgi:hypothetical protein
LHARSQVVKIAGTKHVRRRRRRGRRRVGIPVLDGDELVVLFREPCPVMERGHVAAVASKRKKEGRSPGDLHLGWDATTVFASEGKWDCFETARERFVVMGVGSELCLSNSCVDAR